MEKFRLFRRHAVYPSSPLVPPPAAGSGGGARQHHQHHGAGAAGYGSWCSGPPQRSSPMPTDMEMSTKMLQETRQNQWVAPPQQHQIRLFPPSPPPPYRPLAPPPPPPPATQLEMKQLNPPEAVTEPSAIVTVAPKKEEELKVELPQSPVPSSPSRSNKKGIFSIASLFHPLTTIDPQGVLYISWLLVVTLTYGYNSWCIPMRATFPYQTEDNTGRWMSADYVADAVYLVDVVLVKPRLMYLHDGFWVDDPAETRKNYRKKLQYKVLVLAIAQFDVISLLPLDILYVWLGTSAVLLRLPRLLKLQTFWEFHQTMDRVLSSPYLVRVGKTLFYIFYLIHLNACAYYAMSVYEGLASNGWVFDGVGNAYIRCFYFATKTATSIGKNPKPENEAEYLFMTAAWLMGVFVFALLIGQIRDIIATATRAQTEYRKMVDGCTRYMRRLNMPPSLQRRVTAWFTFTWQQQRCFDESRILDSLPSNMKRDVALAVHMRTLGKVQLFRDCSASLLRDLVLQLRPVSFLPGDLVCRRGDVGNHMYIVKMGRVLVMGPDEREVLATLCEGSVFGEISLLGIEGSRRRTATVRSSGYSNLFALSKSDLELALHHHREAAHVLRRRDIMSSGYSNLFALSKSDLELALRHHREAAHVLRRRADTLVRENAARLAERAAAAAGAAGAGAERPPHRKRRSAASVSAHARRHSALSDNKACGSSLASSCGGMRTPLPTIMLTEE